MTEVNGAEHYEVLIIGGGMVGSAIACALGQQKIRVAVFDRLQPEVFDKSQLPDLRVSALSYASEQFLRNLNAWQHIEQMRTCPYRRMAVWEKLHLPGGKELDKRPNQTLFDACEIDHEQLGFIVENRVTQLGLIKSLQQLETVGLYCPATIESMSFSEQNSSITLSDGRTFTGNLVIGADGANSQVRQQAGIRLDYRDYEQQCMVATVEIEGGVQDITWQAFTETGPESFLPLPDIDGKSYASVVWYNLPENISRLMKLSDQEFIDELTRTFPIELPGIVKLHERGFFPLARRHALEYHKNGAVLAGDSAHTINPLAGQGVNLGFQDAACLAEILIEAHKAGESLGDSEVLGRYEKARRQGNQLMMSTMDAFYHAFSNDIKPLKMVRNLALGLAGATKPAVKEVMKYAMGISGDLPSLARKK
ncbi:hypothetical protein EOPP23_09815 [Endozoicomonas sp. OPT23]|nr:hypothetical protein [Endozoicomonas sp. OPT23]